ncbi:MAG TPA: AgmX/PglI C-terminal domain-containing protein, partial [Planctomycetota bacterium]|nr:AgmX/PglI C-terminal domain-containing protein [Planctomycetota bacterium]
PGMWTAAVAGALVVAAAAAVLLLLTRGNGSRDQSAGGGAGEPDRDAAHQEAPPSQESRWSRRFTSPEQRAALERAIQEARIRRAAGGVPREAPPPPRSIGKRKIPAAGQASAGGDDGDLDKEYIRSVVHDAQPLLRECYELALDEDPTLSGKLTVEFTITGEPDVGGLVEEATTSKEGIGANQTLAECVAETMLSLQFPAPANGGVVQVRYPFLFATDGEPAAEQSAPPPAKQTQRPRPPPSSQAPEPREPAPAPLSTKYGPAELTEQAREQARLGQWAKALSLCESAASMAPTDQDNAMVCALAACNSRNAPAARKHIARLRSPSRRGMVHQ